MQLLPIRAVDIDFAFQESAFFNGNALRRDIPGDRGGLPQVHAVTGLNVALQFSLHHHAFRVDAGLHLAIGAHRKAVVP
jgi:hypothetical protein